jgi:hypothetical protein
MKATFVVLALFSPTLASASSLSRKDVLELPAKVADWQLAHMDSAAHHAHERRDARAEELGTGRVLGGHDTARRRLRRKAFSRGNSRHGPHE